jgi:tetratricopeptide (TPR) repeat protein
MKLPRLVASVFPLLCATLPAQTASPAAPTTDQGLAALQSGQPAQALADFQQILQTDPNNAVATLYAATAALEQYNGSLAVQYAEKARQLDPQSWKVHTTLVAAYAAAGMKPQRDQERDVLAQLHSTGAPDARQASGFLLEMFQTGSAQVEAIQNFAPMGKFHTYYRFLVRQAATHNSEEIDVESNDFDQRSWAQAHPTQAAGGERQFQLTGRSKAGETDNRMFSGKLDYDTIRAMVVAILQSQTPPPASSQ